MPDILLQSNEEFCPNSEIINVKHGNIYKVSTRTTGFKIQPFCAYFGIIILDHNNKEIERKIRWLNDTSMIEKETSIIFKATSERIVLIYRINTETPRVSNCHYTVLPLENVTISELSGEISESYDDPNEPLPASKELTTEQEAILEKNLVWILGTARSGTTWLLHQLSYNTGTMDEPFITQQLTFSVRGITDKIVRVIDQRANKIDYFFSKRYKNTWLFFLRKLILNRIYAQFPDLSQKIIIKEAMTIGSSDIIQECLPNSKIIILLRDGRDVMDSRLDAILPDSWMTKVGVTPMKPEDRIETIKFLAMAWVETIEILMKTHHEHKKELQILVRYEDLRKNTLEELQKIYDFLQIDIKRNELEKIVEKNRFENIPNELKGKGKFTRFASIGKWEENFTEFEKSIINEIMGSTLEKIGYNIHNNKM